MFFQRPWVGCSGSCSGPAECYCVPTPIRAATDADIPSDAIWAAGVDRSGGMAIGIAADAGPVDQLWHYDGEWYRHTRLNMDLSVIDLNVLACGDLPLLLNHREDPRLGTVVAAWVSDLRFFVAWVWHWNGAARQARRDVHSGILRGLSIKPYPIAPHVVINERPTPGRPGSNTMLAWEPLEVSLCRHGANPRAIVVNPGP